MNKLAKTLLLLFLLASPVVSWSQERKVSGSWQNVPLRTVLNDLEKQSGFTFAYRTAEIDLEKRVSDEAKGEDILQLLGRILAPQQMSASIEGTQIMLLQKRGEDPKKTAPSTPKRTFSGTVVATTDRSPLAGVTVYVKGTSTGTLTDTEGRYSLTVGADVKEITFSMLGYLDKNIKTTENDNYFRMVFLDESSTALSEAVVVAFGTTQKRESIVTSVESINPEQLKSLHSPTLSQSFAGNLAGVISTQSSGEPGSDGANFWIRGISTFGPNSKPLYILDGIEVGVGVLDGISPESIESFAVLKDAAATALYGSRGANGVMVITTKSGRTSDKMSINVHFNSTVNTFTKVSEIADGITYMENYNEALRTRGGNDYYLPAKIEAAKQGINNYEYPLVNWYDMIFRKYSTAQSADVNIRGGGNRVNYFLSAMFANQNGMLRNSPEVSFDTGLNARKFSFQSNVTAKLTNSTTASIKMTSILFYKNMPYYSTQHYFAAALYANPVNVSPTYPSEWLGNDADYVVFGGTDEWDGTTSWTNPYMDLSEGYRKQFTENTTTSVRLDQNLDMITPGLKLWGQASFYSYTAATLTFRKAPWLYRLQGIDTDPVSGEKTYYLSQLGSEGSKYIGSDTSSSGYRELNLQTNLEYARSFGPHYINAVVLYHQKEHVDNQASSYNARLPKREQGFAGRLSYTLLDRYVLEANFGYNGSENFMRGHRWGFFPSMAAGWIISNEPFWDNLRSTVDLLKIRYSYGLSGNDYLSVRFPYISSVAMNVNSGFIQGSCADGFYSEKGNVVNLWGNEDATWEVSRKHDIGIEFGFMKQLKFILDIFDENRTGIFMARQVLPATTGLSGVSPRGNLGAVRNRGVDFSLEYKRIFNPDFSISARGTFTYAHNEITDYDEPEIQPYPYQSKIGQPVYAPYGLIAEGLFKDQEDIDNSPTQTFSTNYKPGDIKYKNMNDDDVIDENDATYLGLPTVPEINYGFGATMKYKSFDFSFFFSGRDRVSILMSDAVHPFVNKTHRGLNMFKWVADDHWSESNPNPDAKYPRLDWEYNPNNIPASSFWLRDGKFLRLKNVELGWTWKETLRVYCTGTNLFVLSPFKLWDPELANGAGVSYPLTKSVQLGLQLFF